MKIRFALLPLSLLTILSFLTLNPSNFPVRAQPLTQNPTPASLPAEKTAADLMQLALLSIQEGLFADAVDAATEALNLDPTLVEGYYQRGIAYLSLGSMEDLHNAVADFSRVLELDPEYTAAYVALGDIDRIQGKNVEAIAHYTQALDVDPQWTDAYWGRSEARFNANDERKGLQNLSLPDEEVQAVIDDCTSAINLDPDRPAPYYKRALMYLYRKEYEAAIQDLKSAYDRLHREDIYLLIGDIYRETGDADQALAAYTTQITDSFRLSHETTVAYQRRASLYVDMGRFDDAYADLDIAFQRDPYWYPTYATFGKLYALQGYDVDAVIAYHQYLDLAGDQAQPEVIAAAQELEDQLQTQFSTGVVSEGCVGIVIAYAPVEILEQPYSSYFDDYRQTGDQVDVTGQNRHWYRVQLSSGFTGWISKINLLPPQGPDCATLPVEN